MISSHLPIPSLLCFSLFSALTSNPPKSHQRKEQEHCPSVVSSYGATHSGEEVKTTRLQKIKAMHHFGGAAAFPMISASSLFSVYTSLTALVTLLQQFYHQFIPKLVRDYIRKKIEARFTKSSSSTTLLTLVIEKFEDGDSGYPNRVYDACEAYLANKLKSTSNRLKVSRSVRSKEIVSFKLAKCEEHSEHYEGMKLDWSFICDNGANSSPPDEGKNRLSRARRSQNYCFELAFDPKHKEKVYESYLPFIIKSYEDMAENKKELHLFSLDFSMGKPGSWRSVSFKHPFTFEVLAMQPEVKRAVTDDLDRFLKRREFYKKVGRAWKRGYLLYGPPGTGKSSLVAAMANYLKFDIYDLQLSSVKNDSTLRRLLLSTSNKSILVIEDIDCSLALVDRQLQTSEEKDEDGNTADKGSQISLSGLLNFIDGLWSSCGDERIFVFTTNHKDKLDPALLRPGRMDMHIHMSYLTMPGFRVLSSNYLDVVGEHHLFKEIEELLESTEVTPAQVAEELIRSEEADVALASLVDMLKKKKSKEMLKKSTSESKDVQVETTEHRP